MLPKHHTHPHALRSSFFTRTRHPIFQLAVLRGDTSLPSTPLQRTTSLLAQLLSQHCHRRALSPNPRQSCTFGGRERENGNRRQKPAGLRALRNETRLRKNVNKLSNKEKACSSATPLAKFYNRMKRYLLN